MDKSVTPRVAVCKRAFSLIIRIACLLVSLLSWLVITVIGVIFLTSEPLTPATDPLTGDPILEEHIFRLGPSSFSSSITVDVNAQTKLVAGAIVVLATLGLGFFVYLLLGGKLLRIGAKQSSQEERPTRK